MLQATRRAKKAPPTPKRLSLNNWVDGYQSTNDSDRTTQQGLFTALNQMLKQNGTIAPRYSRVPYGNPLQSRYEIISGTINYITNPNFETNITGWTAYNAAALTQSSAQAFVSGNSMRVVTTGTGANFLQGASATPVTVTPGSTYTFSLWVKGTAGDTVRAYVGSGGTDTYSQFALTGAWQRITNTHTAITSTLTAFFMVEAGNSAVRTAYIDAVQLEAGTTATDFFDGNTTSTLTANYGWNGTVGASSSARNIYNVGTAKVLGEITEFTKRSGTTVTNYEISVQVVSGTANAYYRKDGGTWTIATGKTFDTTARCHFCPIRDIDASYNDQDKVLILNGTDTLSYLDINTLTVVPFTALPAASAPTLAVGTGITGTNYSHFYKVTAGNRGQTAASAETKATTQTPRSEWSGATQYIDVTITRVTGANRYHVYYSPVSGQELYLGSIDDPGTGTTVTYRDSGTVTVDVTVSQPAPAGDTTAGPIGTRASFINGQVFITGDKVNPKYVRYGGTGTSILDFSPYGGGGYEPVGGNKEVPVKVAAFRKNDGTAAITVLCKGTNGFGKRYIFEPRTLGNTSYFAITEENGNDGTEAPDSVLLAHDQLWYLSRDAIKTTLTKAQVQTILSTEGVSDKIQREVSNLNTQSLELSCGAVWENRLYWSVAVGASSNNQVWMLDLSNQRKGAFMLPWNMNVDWMWLYNDNSGKSHFCTLENNQVYEFTDAVNTQDNSVAFPTKMKTGLLKFSPDGQDWAQVLKVIFVVQRPQGTITVGITGETEDDPLTVIQPETFNVTSDTVGWSEAGWGELGWSENGLVPTTYGVERKEIEIEVDEELKWLSCELSTLGANASYELTDIIVEYIPTGTKD